MTPKILVMYDSRTGNTRRLAEEIVKGVNQSSQATAELKKAENVNPKQASKADGYAIGSPSHFSIMSGRILTLLTNLYSVRDQMADKPTAVFTTGKGSQVTTLENLERVVGSFNPTWIKPGLAVEGEPNESDRKQAVKMGEKLAKKTARKTG